MNKIVHNVWFKCITVLLLISLIAGGLLAVLNDVLYVSDEERTGRAIKKIYEEEKQYEVILDSDKDEAEIYETGRIDKHFIVDGTDTLIRATGFNGYKNGTITLWVKIIEKDGEIVIDKVILESYDKQTLMSKLDENYYKNFTLKDVTDNYFTLDATDSEYGNPVSGATKSATAGSNAVNCAIKYYKENAK